MSKQIQASTPAHDAHSTRAHDLDLQPIGNACTTSRMPLMTRHAPCYRITTRTDVEACGKVRVAQNVPISPKSLTPCGHDRSARVWHAHRAPRVHSQGTTGSGTAHSLAATQLTNYVLNVGHPITWLHFNASSATHFNHCRLRSTTMMF